MAWCSRSRLVGKERSPDVGCDARGGSQGCPAGSPATDRLAYARADEPVTLFAVRESDAPARRLGLRATSSVHEASRMGARLGYTYTDGLPKIPRLLASGVRGRDGAYHDADGRRPRSPTPAISWCSRATSLHLPQIDAPSACATIRM